MADWCFYCEALGLDGKSYEMAPYYVIINVPDMIESRDEIVRFIVNGKQQGGNFDIFREISDAEGAKSAKMEIFQILKNKKKPSEMSEDELFRRDVVATLEVLTRRIVSKKYWGNKAVYDESVEPALKDQYYEDYLQLTKLTASMPTGILDAVKAFGSGFLICYLDWEKKMDDVLIKQGLEMQYPELAGYLSKEK